MIASAKEKGRKKKAKRSARLSVEIRRELIVTAARAVFAKSGFSGSRTKEIARKAGINEALIYRHFKSKEELFDYAVIEPLERWMHSYKHQGPQIAVEPSAESRLHMLERGGAEYLEEMHRIVPLLGIALFGRDDHAKHLYKTRIEPLIAEWARNVARSLPKNARGWDVGPEFLAISGFATHFFLSADAHLRGVPLDSAKLAHQIALMSLPLYEKNEQQRPPVAQKRNVKVS
ncbi:MAG TPA: helix-turn-helix domain-containing protein [Rhizomicrobium sp.]